MLLLVYLSLLRTFDESVGYYQTSPSGARHQTLCLEILLDNASLFVCCISKTSLEKEFGPLKSGIVGIVVKPSLVKKRLGFIKGGQRLLYFTRGNECRCIFT